MNEEHGSCKLEETKGDFERDSGENDQQKLIIIHVVSPCLYTSVHRGVWNYSVRVIGSGVGL